METHEIEYKETWRDNYLLIISAFANSGGGKLLLGVNDKGEAIGIQNIQKLLEDLPNKIRDKLGIISEVNLVNRDNKKIIEIAVKPSTFAVSYNGKFYVRVGSTTQELNGEELVNFLLQKSGQTWDELTEQRAKLEDIDITSIEHFKTLAKDKIPSIELEKDWKSILTKLNILKDDKLKRAGILLFGKNPQEFFIQAKTRIGRFKSATDIISTDIIEGNLFEQLHKTMDVLKTKYLISKIEYEDIHRKEILEYPYEALREAILNALIHRDYTSTSEIQIRVYDDKLVIMNSGKLPPDISVENLKKEHPSRPRNPLLASVFFYAGYIETWGRGTIKIIEACKAQGLPEPEFENEQGIMKVTFYKDIYNEENLRKMGLNERQVKAVLFIKDKGKITNKEYRELNKISDEGARLDLKMLVDKGIVTINGKGRNVYYTLK